jgi:manganese/zinc/iron transport system permease protein
MWLTGVGGDAYTAFWTIVCACVCSVMCAILGVWLVLQRVSMIGDAISHSVLPGLVLAFLFFGTRAPVPMFIGAAVAGVLTAVLTKVIARSSTVKEDASMGVVFTVLFALGVVMISRFARQIDLDPNCVLYGLIEFVTLDTAWLAGLEVPRVLVVLVPGLLLSAVFLLLFRKEMLLMSFDPGLAATLGKRPMPVYYAFMAMVAIATVASFEAVGSILVIAMLIVPGATAQLLTRKLRPMFGIAIVLAVAASVMGYWSAVRWNTSIAGMMAVWLGMYYAGAVAFSPAGGLLSRSVERWRRVRAIEEEDALAAVFRAREGGFPATAPSIATILGSAWFRARALARLVRSGHLDRSEGAYSLTEKGLGEAKKMVRRHRLLESFYVDQMDRAADHVHEPAHRAEHFLTGQGEQAVQESLADAAKDPHGKEIPGQG